MFSLKVLKANGETKFVERGEREAYLVATSAYEEGDRVVLDTVENRSILCSRLTMLWELH